MGENKLKIGNSKGIVTYPHRPSIVGLASSDETPLVLKISDELPAVS